MNKINKEFLNIINEYENIISKMNYIPRITEVRFDYETNDCKKDLISTTNKLKDFIKEFEYEK